MPILNRMSDSKHNITDIINTYSKRLLGFISRRVPRSVDAEDILQEVFYQLAGSLTSVEQVRSWLFAVARNKITDQQRKKKPDLFADLAGNDDEDNDSVTLGLVLPEDTGPESAYLRSIFWEQLYKALEELPSDQREVFLLHEMEDFSFKEIAAKTGVPVNTLLSKKRYAVLYLRERLRPLYEELLTD